MKPLVILPIITAIAGFGIGWLVKPAQEAPASTATKRPVRETPRPAPTEPEPTEEQAQDTRKPRTDLATPSTTQAVADDSSIKSLDDAKMARLIEALNLNEDQQAAVKTAMEAARATLEPGEAVDPTKLMEIAALAGADLEKAMHAMLTPEQVSAFTALRKRSQDNSIEKNTQDRVSNLASLMDLSTEQRSIILDRIREGVRKEYAERPPGLDLVLDTSPIPTGSAFLADSSVASMPYLAGGPDANENLEKLQSIQRTNLDAQIEQFKDILTPAQLSRLQLDIENKKRILDKISELTK